MMIRDFDRYVVIKNSHAEQALTKEEHEQIYTLAMKVAKWRKDNEKQPFECLVVEHDWPEYEPVWNMIEHRVDNPVNNILTTGTEHVVEYGECFLHVNNVGEIKLIDPSRVTIHGGDKS